MNIDMNNIDSNINTEKERTKSAADPYHALLKSIAISAAADGGITAEDLLPVCYRYAPEDQISVRPERYLHLTAGGRTDVSAPLSFSIQRSGGLFVLSSLRGSGEFVSGRSVLPLSTGSVLLFDCAGACRLRSSLLPWSFRLFHLDGAPLQDFLPFLNHFYLTTGSGNPAMAFWTEELGALPAGIRPASLLYMHRILTDILSEACISSLPRSRETEPKVPSYLQDLHRYIHDCANLTFSLPDLESLYGISRYQLCREYQAAYHISPLKDFNRVRIREAKKLLLNTNLQVQEISSRLGYENINHFVHLFKMETGMTPGAFRSAGH